MTDIPKPANFEWVRARSECSYQHVFKELENGVRGDVESVKSLLIPGSPIRYSVTPLERGRFSVVRAEADDSFRDSVDFILANGAITAQDDDNTFRHTATLTLDNEGKCKLKVGNNELDQWQFRRMALEKLFFAPRRSS
jgi:hypothetical protein